MDQFDILNEVAEREEFSYAALNTLDRERGKEEKRQKRINDCGSWSYWFNPHTGGKESYMFRCQMFRECEVCLRDRAEKEQERLQDKMIDEQPMSWIIVPDEQIKKTLRNSGASKDDYVCYPLQNETQLLIIYSDFNVGEPVTFTWITAQDWTNIANTPVGRNKSGTLTVPPAPEDEEAFSIVEVELFITTASGETVNSIMDEAIQETFDMHPETIEEIERCLSIRTDKAIKLLKELGHSVTIYYRNFKVTHCDISWSFNSVNTENITSKIRSARDPVPV